MGGTNNAAPLVAEYTQKKMLSKLGYTFSGDDLTYFDVECYTIIANKFADLESKDRKRGKK